ncbi:HNH endonuclease [Chryseobacterium takakiae]|uniref:HNH endonuclease n=1 Tax=Chryseobacterium takakiae TaxID=1302685 RepID=A0A1M4WCN5_9FLAO|nr:HNH endonuclease signature motif containing protein [Chryseobacterium takakiae]SHE78986.1 HNH endonuclease [Chryseobacterium takakiae]
MSKTSFDASTRTGIWKANKAKCFYCYTDIEFKDLHIDHIIPEGLSEEKLKELILEYGLNESFTINSFENLVPTHRICNQRKTDLVFNKASILYYLGLNAKNVELIKREINTLKRNNSFNQLYSKIVSALDQNHINLDDLTNIINEKKSVDWHEKEIKLPIAIDFANDSFNKFSFDINLDSLYDKKMIFGGVFESIDLRNNVNDEVTISNLREWIDATNKGFYPLTNTDIKLSENVDFLDNLLRAIKNAKLPKVSFLDDILITDLDYLSPKILFDPEKKFHINIRNKDSVGDLFRKNLVNVTEENLYNISIEFDGFKTSISEQFRADLNDDGIEDILVRKWNRAINGSLGFGETIILTRQSTKSLIEPI